jgi:N-acetylmuramoyl-L-alanine amidase
LVFTLLLAASAQSLAEAVPVVAIDVGHSNANPGATSARGVPEFEFNAALAKVIRDALSSRGARIVPIGDDGMALDLRLRTTAAADGGATFLLSIHHDSAQPQYFKRWEWQGVERGYADQFSGFSLFVSRKNPRLEGSLHCASAIGAALKEQGLHPSPHHAENIPGESREWADKNNGVYYYDELVVLKTATMPAVLLEAGVIVNRREEQAMQQPEMRSAISAAVERGLIACGAMK